MIEEWGELPEGWEWKSLSDLVEVRKGKKPAEFQEQIGATGLPYIDIQAFENGNLRRYADQSLGVKVTEEDVLIVWDGARSGLVGRGVRGLLGSTIAALRPKEADKNYLRMFLHSKYGDINSNTRGTGIPHVKPEFLWALQVPLPPLPEQLRIVEKLERLLAESCTAREALERAPTLLKRFRQAVLAKAFRGELTERDPDDEPVSVLLERIRAERRRKWEEDLRAKGKDPKKAKYVEPEPPDTGELPELPEGWAWTNFEQLVSDFRSGTTAVPSDETTVYPILRSSSIRPRQVNYSDVRFVSEGDSRNSNDFLELGDLLFTRLSGSLEYVGNCALVRDPEASRIQYPDRIFRAKLIIRDLGQHLENWFSTPFMRGRIAILAKSTAGHQRISMGAIRQQPIPLAPLPEQRRIVAQIENLFAQAEAIEQAVEVARRRAEKVEQAVLARAFRGEL